VGRDQESLAAEGCCGILAECLAGSLQPNKEAKFPRNQSKRKGKRLTGRIISRKMEKIPK
jgi:hypothetical protein